MSSPRIVIKLGGESGQGINSIGEVLAKVMKRQGYGIFGYREYPSLIRGGYSSYQLDVAEQPLRSASKECDLLVCLSRLSLRKYLSTVKAGGCIIHVLPKFEATEEEQQLLEKRNISLQFIDAENTVHDKGGKPIMINTYMTGVLCQILGLPLAKVEELLTEQFAKKPQVLEQNIAFLRLGAELQQADLPKLSLPDKTSADRADDYLLTGNHAFVLGAVQAGVRAYFAYPMTPSSSILTFAAASYHQTGMLVKQIEDEISVAQFALGAMHMGTRALVATSGGGFDLMTESLSMSGITEIPFVCIIGQRPGPATGLPTWTATGDLNLAVYAGHGEYVRLVLAASDPESCVRLVGEAFNLAEKYQIPVLILSEKMIAESLYAVNEFPKALPIERHLVADDQLATTQSTDRYKDSETGVSPRWLPGQSPAVFDANSDEHTGDGSLTEEADPVQVMMDKRLRKTSHLLAELPEPELFGPAEADITFVGWGSVKGVMLDSMNERTDGPTFQYLHYEYMFPVKTEKFLQTVKNAKRVVLIENNAFGQLGALLTQHTGYQFTEKFLKYNGRPFFIEDINAYVMR
jgi:2-oxoglutarate ferredoxin oxidoreductase subunit alpha